MEDPPAQSKPPRRGEGRRSGWTLNSCSGRRTSRLVGGRRLILAGIAWACALSGAWVELPVLALPGPATVTTAGATNSRGTAIAVRWQPDREATNRWAVEVRGLQRATLHRLRDSVEMEAEWGKVLSVVAEQGDLIADIGLPSMLGRYRVEGGSLWFHPRFPLEPGVSYRAVVRLRDLPGEPVDFSLSSTFRIPVPARVPTTWVAQIYPSASELPENLLKFYLEFSAPMSGGHIYDHIRLLDDSGRPVELPFLEIDEELWDPTMTRLTLFIDPGRIKRGVTPLEEVGPALQAGHSFTLVIDAGWPDAGGAPLKAGFRKTFRVGPPNRSPIDPGRWTIRAPTAGSSDALVVRFDRPLDWALSRRVIQVRRGSAAALAGSVTVRDEEREWRFTPVRAWTRGSWEIVVAATIEDLAGNNIGKSFEVDLFEKVQRRVTNAVSRLPFEVR